MITMWSIESRHNTGTPALSVEAQSGRILTLTGRRVVRTLTQCAQLRMISRQINPVDPGAITKESARDPVLSTVIRYTRDGWPSDHENGKTDKNEKFVYGVKFFRKLQEPLSTTKGCLVHGRD